MHKTKEHSTFSNIFFFLKMMFKISPMLVIGECLTGLLINLPTRLIAVLGVKYVIDTVSSGENKIKICSRYCRTASDKRAFKMDLQRIFSSCRKRKDDKGLKHKVLSESKKP